MARESDATNHSNHHLADNNTVNILKLVLLLVEDGDFEEQLGQKCKAETLNLFKLEIAKVTTEIPLHKYQIYTKENQNKIPLNSDQESDEDNKIDLDTNDKDIY